MPVAQPADSLDGFGYDDPEHFGDASTQRFLARKEPSKHQNPTVRRDNRLRLSFVSVNRGDKLAGSDHAARAVTVYSEWDAVVQISMPLELPTAMKRLSGLKVTLLIWRLERGSSNLSV